MTAAAFKAAFSDFRLIKGRKVASLMFEVPLEAADAALAALGGLPRPDQESWVAIARLDEKAATTPPKPEKERRSFDELPLPQQAALRCGDMEFRRFLRRHGEPCPDESAAAAIVRDICGVGSRAEFGVDGSRAALNWERLNNEFREWSRA